MQQKLLQKEQIKKSGDLIGNENADKITNFSKNCPTEFHSMEFCIQKMMMPIMKQKHQKKEEDTYHQKKDNKFLMN